jgi:hypothetical protein
MNDGKGKTADKKGESRKTCDSPPINHNSQLMLPLDTHTDTNPKLKGISDVNPGIPVILWDSVLTRCNPGTDYQYPTLRQILLT